MVSRAYWVAFKTLLRKEIRRFSRIWVQTILPPVITTALYFIIFGNLIGRQLPAIEGYRYIDYIVPGLILMSIISNAYANVVSSFYGSKFQHYVEEQLIAPIPSWVILIGYLSGGVARGLSVGAAVTLVSQVFTSLPLHNLWVVFSMALLTSILFSLGGFINAVYAQSFDDITIIPTFVLTPLTYLGGIFYSIDMLPESWRCISLGNPILYLINAFRYGFLGVSDIGLLQAYAIVLLFISVLFAYSLYLLKVGRGLKS